MARNVSTSIDYQFPRHCPLCGADCYCVCAVRPGGGVEFQGCAMGFGGGYALAFDVVGIHGEDFGLGGYRDGVCGRVWNKGYSLLCRSGYTCRVVGCGVVGVDACGGEVHTLPVGEHLSVVAPGTCVCRVCCAGLQAVHHPGAVACAETVDGTQESSFAVAEAGRAVFKFRVVREARHTPEEYRRAVGDVRHGEVLRHVAVHGRGEECHGGLGVDAVGGAEAADMDLVVQVGGEVLEMYAVAVEVVDDDSRPRGEARRAKLNPAVQRAYRVVPHHIRTVVTYIPNLQRRNHKARRWRDDEKMPSPFIKLSISRMWMKYGSISIIRK